VGHVRLGWVEGFRLGHVLLERIGHHLPKAPVVRLVEGASVLGNSHMS